MPKMTKNGTPSLTGAPEQAATAKQYAFSKPNGCSKDDLWRAYLVVPDPITHRAVMEKLADSGIKVSETWVSKHVARYKFASKRRMLLAIQMDPEDLDEEKIRAFLEKMGKDYNPLLALQGLQSRIVAVCAIKLPKLEDPGFIIKMADAYRLFTDELLRTYQYKLAAGQIVPLKGQNPTGETIVPFAKRPS